MAQILPMHLQQQSAQQQPPPVFGVQAATSSTSDPLFDALVKYITSGPTAQVTSATQLQSLVDNYTSAPGGRDYLENIVGLQTVEDMPPIKMWKHESSVRGFASTNMSQLTVDFTAVEARKQFRGVARGIFGISPVLVFDRNTTFYYDDINEITVDVPLPFVAKSFKNLNFFLVQFSDASGKMVAELWHTNGTIPMPPHGAQGTGKFTHIWIEPPPTS